MFEAGSRVVARECDGREVRGVVDPRADERSPRTRATGRRQRRRATEVDAAMGDVAHAHGDIDAVDRGEAHGDLALAERVGERPTGSVEASVEWVAVGEDALGDGDVTGVC